MLWLIIGVLFGAILTFLVLSSRAGKVSLKWYQWALGVVAAGFLLLAIQNYLALQDELELKLATFTLLAFGLPAVIAAALAWALPLALGRRAR